MESIYELIYKIETVTDIEYRLGVAKGEGAGEGRTESLELANGNSYLRRLTTRSCCLA